MGRSGKSTKSRNGCFTCKERKKKCDETKPVCDNCKRLKLKCRYGLKLTWKQLEVLECLNYVHTTSSDKFISFTVTDFELGNMGNCQSKSFNSELLGGSTTEYFTKLYTKDEIELLKRNAHISAKVDETVLFDLYINVLSQTKSFAGIESANNDFISIVIPGCVKFPALYQSVLALSALDLIKMELKKNKEEQDEQLLNIYNSLFITYKNDALNYLHDILDGFDIHAVEMLEELVITIILLCNIEITNKGNKEWVRYLSEASLIFSALTPAKIAQSEIFMFAYKYFSLRHILLLTTLTSNSYRLFTDSTRWPIIPHFFQSVFIESMYGCSPELLYCIYQITLYNNLFENGEISTPFFIAKITGIWYRLNLLIQQKSSESEELIMSAHCYFNSTKIYLYHILQRNNLESYLDDKIDMYVPNLWSQLLDLSQSKKSLFFPNWCLLIVIMTRNYGFEEDKRSEALKLLHQLEINWPLSSVVQIRNAIIIVWKIYDLTSVCDATDKSTFDYREVFATNKFYLALT